MRNIEREIFICYYDSIEAKLQELHAAEIAIDRMRIEHHPDLVTRVTVDGKTVAEFKITPIAL